MNITLGLSPELESWINVQARLAGVNADQFALQVLEDERQDQARRELAIHVVQTWMDEADATEQEETGDWLIRALDEDRLSDRKLFPPDKKGVTW